MNIVITKEQREYISEMIKLDIKVGDIIMGGKFKNKKVVVKTIGKNDKGDITINGKPLLRFRLIKESTRHDELFSELPIFLKRRITMSDLEWLDKELQLGARLMPPTDTFDTFSDYVIGALLHEFLVTVKNDEIKTIIVPDHGEMYDDDSLQEIGDIYFSLKPFIAKKYETILRRALEVKKTL